jgi:hypothetical protein
MFFKVSLAGNTVPENPNDNSMATNFGDGKEST